jgi:hypothetical protein
MKEIWKDIKGYEKLYWISNLGRVKSKRKILKPCVNKRTGYIYVCLTKNNKGKDMVIHRLVAQVFIPNPNNLPQVNHKDENKNNNCVNNLEWCTPKYNCNYGTRNSKLYNKTSFRKGHKPKSCKKVEKYSLDGLLLDTYYSIREAGRKNNFSASSIYKSCEGKTKCKNYIWKYADK